MTTDVFKWEGADQILKDFEKFGVDTDTAIPAALVAGALPIQNQWKRNIVFHHGASPYSTGTYLRSVHTEVEKVGSEWVAELGTDIVDPPYPFFLEYGWHAVNGVEVGPFPSARPAIDEMSDEAEREVIAVLALIADRAGIHT